MSATSVRALSVMPGDLNGDGKPDFIWTIPQAPYILTLFSKYDPVAQTITTALLYYFNDGSFVQADAHFLTNASGQTSPSGTQLLMHRQFNSTMSLEWLGSAGGGGGNPVGNRSWEGMNYIATGQFLNTGTGVASILLSDAQNNLQDWWFPPGTFQGGPVNKFNVIALPGGVPWVNKQFIGAGHFFSSNATDFLVQDSANQNHLYAWSITSQPALTGIDLSVDPLTQLANGQTWDQKQLLTVGNFDNLALANRNEWLVVVNDPSNQSGVNNHILEWRVDQVTNSQGQLVNTLQGIDLSASGAKTLWGDYDLITIGYFDSNSPFRSGSGPSGAELLVRARANQHLLEWWVTSDGGISGVDLTANSGIGTNVEIFGNSHYNDQNGRALDDEFLVHDLITGDFYEWWTVGVGAQTKIAGVPVADPPASSASSSLLVQSMASFSAGGAVLSSTGALASIDPSQQSVLAAPLNQQLAHR
jgi:hypothetical protein